MFATLALLAGFAAREPSRPHLARVALPARGPLIAADEHPEWKQFLVQAAYRRAGELERLRKLPDTPTIVAKPESTDPAPVASKPEDKVAALPTLADMMPEEITGAIDADPGTMTVEIGETSSVELPLSEQELVPPAQQPESLKPQHDSRQKTKPRPRVRLRAKPPAKPASEPDLLTRIFGSRPAQ